MTYTETIRQGAAAVRRTSTKNIMELLVSIAESNPRAGTELLFSKWSAAVKADDDYEEAVRRHTFTNLYHAMEIKRTPGKQSPVAPRSKEEKEQAIKDIVQQARQIIILDFIMPNGKRLRDCRADYVVRCNKGFAKLVTNLKPNQIVGQALTDDEAQKKWMAK